MAVAPLIFCDVRGRLAKSLCNDRLRQPGSLALLPQQLAELFVTLGVDRLWQCGSPRNPGFRSTTGWRILPKQEKLCSVVSFNCAFPWCALHRRFRRRIMFFILVVWSIIALVIASAACQQERCRIEWLILVLMPTVVGSSAGATQERGLKPYTRQTTTAQLTPPQQQWERVAADNGAAFAIKLDTVGSPEKGIAAATMCQIDVDGHHCVGGDGWGAGCQDILVRLSRPFCRCDAWRRKRMAGSPSLLGYRSRLSDCL
jgi:hypothetical protein